MRSIFLSVFVAGFGLIGCSTSSTTSNNSGTYPEAENCPSWVPKTQLRLVYGPGNAMAIWEGPAEAQEEIRTFVSGIVARLSPNAAIAEGRVIRYEAQEKGAAIIVDDSDTERLDKLRSEFELLASELKEGSCDVALSMARNRSQTASNYEDLSSPN